MPRRFGDEENIELENYHKGESESENQSSGDEDEGCMPIMDELIHLQHNADIEQIINSK
jgi:hypothetical protein